MADEIASKFSAPSKGMKITRRTIDEYAVNHPLSAEDLRERGVTAVLFLESRKAWAMAFLGHTTVAIPVVGSKALVRRYNLETAERGTQPRDR